jgi:gamma-glutamyltranspeptidase/glutathione hydrolase
MPAVRLAREGFVVDRPLAGSLNHVLNQAKQFQEFQRVFTPPPGKPRWQPGDRLVQPELGITLERIANHGPEAFYQGLIADQITAEMRAGGGLITRDDLAAYRPRIRPPIRTTYRGHEVFGPPPPSSGGTCLAEMLNVLENFTLDMDSIQPGSAESTDRWSARTMHLVIETMRRAYRDRARYLGDPDFAAIPAHLTTKDYARKLAAQIDPARATPSASLAPDLLLAEEPKETTHFSVIDKNGMAVANTYTLENSYGSLVVVRGAGFLLNNEMTDFNRIPGRTDRQGYIGTSANQVAPRKRMLSSQTPTIVCRAGRPILITGSPGGRTIINTVLCLVINVVDFRMDPRRAVDMPRLHHPWFPDRISFEGMERPEFKSIIEALRGKGHSFIERKSSQGDAHSIWIEPRTGRFVGAADTRIGGKASGY